MCGGGMIFLWIVVIIIVIVAIKMLLDRSSGGREREIESPLDILKKQYAAGNISKEEYERKKKDLLTD
jgi:putative membrane protein